MSPLSLAWPHPRGSNRLLNSPRPVPWNVCPIICLTNNCSSFKTHVLQETLPSSLGRATQELFSCWTEQGLHMIGSKMIKNPSPQWTASQKGKTRKQSIRVQHYRTLPVSRYSIITDIHLWHILVRKIEPDCNQVSRFNWQLIGIQGIEEHGKNTTRVESAKTRLWNRTIELIISTNTWGWGGAAVMGTVTG